MYYAVHTGREIGVFNTWEECNKQVNKYKSARFKKFNNIDEAKNFVKYGGIQQNNYLENNVLYNTNIVIFTDGSCINNGSKNAKAGIGIYFGDEDPRNISEPYYNNPTNNRAELYAIIKATHIIKNELLNKRSATIYTDSDYCYKCITTFGDKMNESKWTKKCMNKDLVRHIYNIFKIYNNLKIKQIRAHTGGKDLLSIGNAKADKLANIGAMKTDRTNIL